LTNINFDLLLKGKRKAEPDKDTSEEEVWPTMLPVDDPFITRPRVTFFDGATRRVEIDITIETQDPPVFSVSGDRRHFYRPADEYGGESAGLFGNQPIILTYLDEDENLQETAVHCYSSEYMVDDNKTNITIAEESFPTEEIIKAEVWGDVTGWGSEEELTQVFLQEGVDLIGQAPAGSLDTPAEYSVEVYAAEDSRVPPGAIAAEFGEGNAAYRWDRKPLRAFLNQGSIYQYNPQEASAALESHRGCWLMTDGFYNILFQILDQDGGVEQQIDPNGLVDKVYGGYPTQEIPDPLFSMRTMSKYRPDPVGQQDDIYKFKKGSGSGKRHISVQEIGSGSVCHYVKADEYTYNPGNYTYFTPRYALDRIEKTEQVPDPESPGNTKEEKRYANLFFCNFRTDDTDNFKMTTEPSFDGEEFTGLPYDCSGEMEIYLMPRRYLYWMRSRETSIGDDSYLATVTSVLVSSGGTHVISDPGSPFNGFNLMKMTDDYYNNSYKNPRACYDLLSQYPELRGGIYEARHTFFADEEGITGCACGCQADPVNLMFHCLCNDDWYCEVSLFDDPSICSAPAIERCPVSTYPYSWQMDVKTGIHRHKWGMWWDRFPSDLAAMGNGSLSSADNDRLRTFDGLLYESGVYWVNPQPYEWWVESQPNEYIWLEADIDWPTAADINHYPLSPSGLSGFHCFHGPEPEPDDAGIGKTLMVLHNHQPTYVQNGQGYDENGVVYDLTVQDAFTWHFNNACLTIGDGRADADPMRAFWEKIGGIEPSPQSDGLDNEGTSWFYENHGPPSYDSEDTWNRWDNIPFGAGFSPTMPEELVGIVRDKRRDKAIFVWRRTVEDLSCVVIPKLDDYAGGKRSFESSEAIEQDGSNIMSGDINGADLGLLDQFLVAESTGRRIEKVGRSVTRGTDGQLGDCPEDYATKITLTMAEDGEHELHAPVFPLLSKERAIRASPADRTYAEWLADLAEDLSPDHGTDLSMLRFFRMPPGYWIIKINSEENETYPHDRTSPATDWFFTPKNTDPVTMIAIARDSIPFHNKEERNGRRPPH
jgi:hypothetical protein